MRAYKNQIKNTEKMKERILNALGDDFMSTRTIATKIGYGDRMLHTQLYLNILEEEGKIVKQRGLFPKWTAC